MPSKLPKGAVLHTNAREKRNAANAAAEKAAGLETENPIFNQDNWETVKDAGSKFAKSGIAKSRIAKSKDKKVAKSKTAESKTANYKFAKCKRAESIFSKSINSASSQLIFLTDPAKDSPKYHSLM